MGSSKKFIHMHARMSSIHSVTVGKYVVHVYQYTYAYVCVCIFFKLTHKVDMGSSKKIIHMHARMCVHACV